MLRFFSLLLSFVVIAGHGNAPKPVGFKRSFYSPNDIYVRRWSSTGMSGLDHHDPIDKVDLASKKTRSKRVFQETEGMSFTELFVTRMVILSAGILHIMLCLLLYTHRTSPHSSFPRKTPLWKWIVY